MPIFMDFRLFFLFSLCFLRAIAADNNDAEKLVPPNAVNGGGSSGDDISTPNPFLQPPPPPPPDSLPSGRSNNFAPFRPSIAVVVGVLTSMFSITFLLLLYAKHCKRGHGIGVIYGGGIHSRDGLPSSAAARKNSGIDRTVIESLPIFRFGSLRGQKDGLECAVCLTRFETTELLRLLPKCKHAFHVECVDTWLDAHSTCPLCRYRVDAEDILLVDAMILCENEPLQPPQQYQEAVSDIETRRSGTKPELDPGYRRVSGRHSSAGERGSKGFLQIILQKPGELTENSQENPTLTMTPSSFRRSLDSSSLKRKNNESVNLGCYEHRPRKDGLLLLSDKNRTSFEQRRFEHRIVVSADHHQQQLRWSDVQPSDLLYLRSEMILSDSRRYSSGSRPASSKSRRQRHHDQNHHNQVQVVQAVQEGEESSGSATVCIDGGRSVINTRSVSEITGLSRFPGNYNNNNRHLQQQLQHRQRQQRQAGLVSRWLAWISQSQSQPAVRSDDIAVSRVA